MKERETLVTFAELLADIDEYFFGFPLTTRERAVVYGTLLVGAVITAVAAASIVYNTVLLGGLQ